MCYFTFEYLQTMDEKLNRISEAMLLLCAVAIPASVKLYLWQIDLEVIFPAEVIIGVTAVFTVVRVLCFNGDVRRRLWRNPIVLAAGFYAVTGIASALYSAMPLVSLKSVTVRLAYMMAFFALPLMAPDGVRLIRRSLLMHAWVLIPIAFWGAAGQVEGGFDRASAGYVVHPLYQDRTIFSAALCFGAVALFSACLATGPSREGRGRVVLQCVGGALILLATIFTYTRAAWLGLVVAAAAFAAVVAARRWRRGGLATMALLCLGLLILGRSAMHLTPSNASAHRTGLAGTIRSITNLTTDPTNMERLNRWSCALRMFLDAPLFGHGPGTYQFVFPPYQRKEERTAISPPDRADLMRSTEFRAQGSPVLIRPGPKDLEYSRGTAHSEYLLALSEGGLLGAIGWLGLLISGLVLGWRACVEQPARLPTDMAMTAFMGLSAYAAHAVFNNYLDDCKVALPFWLSLAALARLREREVVPDS